MIDGQQICFVELLGHLASRWQGHGLILWHVLLVEDTGISPEAEIFCLLLGARQLWFVIEKLRVSCSHRSSREQLEDRDEMRRREKASIHELRHLGQIYTC